MRILSVLAFPATSPLHHGNVQSFVGEHAAASPRADGRFEMIHLAIASKDALQARKALLACPETSILRCLPMHRQDSVKLEIRFPAGQAGAVMGRVLACLPRGEFSGVVACAAPRAKPVRMRSNVFAFREI